jgi:hypothetical protein
MERKLLLVLGACMAMSLSACSFDLAGNSSVGSSSGAHSNVSSNSSSGAQTSSSASSVDPTIAAAAAAVKTEYHVEPFKQCKNQSGEAMPYVVTSATTADGKDQYQLYAGVVRRVPVQITGNYTTQVRLTNFTIKFETKDYSYVENENADTLSKYSHIWSTTSGSTTYATDTHTDTNCSVSLNAGVEAGGYLTVGGSASSGRADYSGITSSQSKSWSYGNDSSSYHTHETFSKVIQEHSFSKSIEFTLPEVEPGVYRYGTFVDCDLYYYAQVYVKDSILVVDDISTQLSPILASTVQGLDYIGGQTLSENPNWYDPLSAARFDVTESYLRNLDYSIQQKYETFSVPSEATPSGDFKFTDDGKGNLTLASFTSTAKDLCEIRVPGAVNGKPVVAVGTGAFKNNQIIRYVYLPANIIDIENNAFDGCSNLARVEIGGKVTNFGDGAFANCPHLRFLNVPSSLTSIGYGVFTNTPRLPFLFEYQKANCYLGDADNPHFILVKARTGSLAFDISPDTKLIAGGAFEGCTTIETLDLTLPDGLIFIGAYAFKNCSLRSIALPNSMTSIVAYCFDGCSVLQNIVIPSSVTLIEYDAFSGCTGLNKVEYESLEYFWSVSYGGSDANPISYAHHLYIGGSEVTSITIPNSVTSIGDYRFAGWSGLKSIAIPSSVTSIGGSAFSGCTGLTSVSVPSSVTSIGDDAFSGCTGLTKAEFASLESLFSISFGYNCSNPLQLAHHLYIGGSEVTELVIPSSVTSIGNGAFQGCTGLVSIAIPSSVTSIGGSAFSGCTGLTSVSIPSSVTSIGGSAFNGCTALTSVVIPFSVTSIARDTFAGCTGLTSALIPESVTSIGDGAFYNCAGLTSIRIPSSVTSIGYDAFFGCTGLVKAEFDSIECLCKIKFGFHGWHANPLFYAHHLYVHGDEVTNLVIPSSITVIGDDTFQGCSSLTSVSIPSSVTAIGDGAFDDCTGLTKAEFASIESLCSIYSTYNGSNPLKLAHHLYIGGSEVTKLVIPSSVTSIGEDNFKGCTGLTSVSIPSSVTSIGRGAFNGCTGLTSVVIPSSVTSIAPETFADCTGLTSVLIPESVTSIGGDAFLHCAGLTSISIPSLVTSIGDGAFQCCTGLVSIVIPSSVTSIGSFAFSNCTSLTSVVIPGSVKKIGEGAFMNCTHAIIYCETVRKPTSWDAYWNEGRLGDQGGTIYWYSETKQTGFWHYVNGVPTLW